MKKISMIVKRWIKFIPLFFLLISSTSLQASQQRVALQLFWKHQFEFAGYYAAKEKGFYREAGLDVDIREYQQGMDVNDEVLTGRAEFATVASTAVLNYLQDKPLKLLANIFKHSAYVFLSLPDAGIRSPHDLYGKRLMLTSGERNAVEFRSFFSKNGIDPSQLTFIDHTFDPMALVTGQAEVMSAYITNQPFILQEKGIAFHLLDPANYGLDFYGDSLISSAKLAEQKPEMVRAFRDASLKGWAYALDHPDEIIDLILRDYNTADKSLDALRYEAKETAKLILPQIYPIGSIDPSRISHIANTMRLVGLTEERADINSFIFDLEDEAEVSRVSAATLAEFHEKLSTEERQWLTEHPKIEIAINKEWPPMDYVDERGNPQGIGVRFIEALNKRLGNRLEIVPGAWQDIYMAVKDKQLDALMDITPKPERADLFNFTSPYVAIPHAIFTNNEQPYIGNIADLAGKRVGIERGFFTAGLLRDNYPNIRVSEYDSTSDVIDALVKGEVDAYIGNRAVAMYIIDTELISNIRENAKISETSSINAIGVRKDWPLLKDILQKALDNIPIMERRALMIKEIRPQLPSAVGLTEEERTWIKSHPVIRAQNEQDWPPINFYEDGHPRGFSIDYMNLLAAKLGIKVEYQSGPSWNDFLQSIQDKQLDVMLNIAKTDARQKYLLYTKPYLPAPNVLVSRNNDPILSINELNGRTVSFPEGFFYEELLTREYPQIKLLPVKNIFTALQAVSEGRADAVLGDEDVLRYQIDKHLLTNLQVTSEIKVSNTNIIELHIGVRNDWPLLQSALNKAIAMVTPEELSILRLRWLNQSAALVNSKADRKASIARLFLWIGLAIVALVVLLLVLRRFGPAFYNHLFLRRHISILVSALFVPFVAGVIFVTLTALEQMERQLREDMGKTLVSINKAVGKSFDFWLEQRIYAAHRIISDQSLLPRVEALLQLPEGSAELLQSSAISRIRELYNHYNDKEIGSEGFFLVSPDGASLASSRILNSNAGNWSLIMEQHPALVERIFAGETVFIPPIFSEVVGRDGNGQTITNFATLFLALPVRDSKGNVIAALVLSFNPGKDFTRISRSGRVGKSGETYSVDREARFISESHLTESLSTIAKYYRDPDSIASLSVRDPGGNLLEGFQPEQRHTDWPITQAVSQVFTDHSSYNIEGYRDYRGVTVLGAWSRIEKLGIGLVTEIDQAEALQSYQSMRLLVLGALSSISTLTLLLFAVSIWVSRKGRKYLEILVEQRTEELRKVGKAIEHNPLCVVITDADGNIEHVNPAFTQITGYEACEVIGENPRLLKSGETPAELYEILWETILAGDTWHGEICNRKKNGELYWVSISIAPVTDAAGNVTHFVAMSADITEAKQIEAELQKKLGELARFRKIAVGRELKMIELKKEINEYCHAQGKEDKYKIVSQTRLDNVGNCIKLVKNE